MSTQNDRDRLYRPNEFGMYPIGEFLDDEITDSEARIASYNAAIAKAKMTIAVLSTLIFVIIFFGLTGSAIFGWLSVDAPVEQPE